jgi:predicted transcriptional regulator
MKLSFIKRLLDPDSALIADYFLTDNGKLNMENPTVQAAILNLIKADLVKRAKEIKAEKKAR